MLCVELLRWQNCSDDAYWYLVMFYLIFSFELMCLWLFRKIQDSKGFSLWISFRLMLLCDDYFPLLTWQSNGSLEMSCLKEHDVLIGMHRKKIDPISMWTTMIYHYNVYRYKRVLLSYFCMNFFFTAQDDNSASCEQETDGLHKALEASILRNEVCCIIHSQLYDVLAVQLGLDIFNMYWSCDPISSS
jgi:hypothetical protein